jgi:DHA2 family lincomycin resistance protein-like MFS transporter
MPAPAQTLPPEPGAEAAPFRTPTVIKLLVLATFVVILNETIMVNAVPRLMTSFEITANTAQWVSTIFMLTMAAVIPATGWFLQRFTTRTAYATAMVAFLVGTAICALAPTFGVLLLGRSVQAAGTAVMMPLLMTTLMNVVPPYARGRVMGNMMLAISVAPAMGPAVSGLILQFGSWRLLFVVVLPIAGLITWTGLRQLTNVGKPAAGEIDWFSVVIAAAGFGSLVYGLTVFAEGESGRSLLVAGLGLVLVIAFVARQFVLIRRGAPLLDLRALRSATYAKALVLMSVSFMAMMGTMILLPLYLQELRGLTPLQTGLLVMPGGLAMGLLGPTVGRLFDRYGSRPLVIPGAIGIVVALAGLTQLDQSTPYWFVLVLHVLLMICLAGTFTPVFTLGLGALPADLYSHGSSILGTLQQVAAAFGTALAVAVMTLRAEALPSLTPALAQMSGMRWSFAVAAGFAVIVVVMALLLPSRAEDAEDAVEEGAEDGDPGEEPEELALASE